MPKTSLAYRLLRPMVGAYAALDMGVQRVRQSLEGGVAGVLSNALSASEGNELTVYLYDRQDTRRSMYEELWPWEQRWFSADLPAPPATLLLGGAGRGREARFLCAAGYRVDAFEPAPSFAEDLRSIVGDAGESATGSYDELVKALEGEPSGLARFAGRRYDAVVLGWGSLTHLLDPEERRALLRACARLAPEGPVLASFWMHEAGRFAARGGRARALGERIGRAIARVRGLPERPAGEANEFGVHCGLVHSFAQAELEELARELGRQLELRPSPYPHATFHLADRVAHEQG